MQHLDACRMDLGSFRWSGDVWSLFENLCYQCSGLLGNWSPPYHIIISTLSTARLVALRLREQHGWWPQASLVQQTRACHKQRLMLLGTCYSVLQHVTTYIFVIICGWVPQISYHFINRYPSILYLRPSHGDWYPAVSTRQSECVISVISEAATSLATCFPEPLPGQPQEEGKGGRW